MPINTLRASVLATMTASLANAAVEAAPPNVVVILVDDLGCGDLSSYGAADLLSPAIDRLVDSGVKFTHAYANSPVCSPTRASLLTGRYPQLVGVPGVIRTHAEDSWGYLTPQALLLPQVLKRAGYHTAIVGKWHLGLEPENHPVRRGFDLFHGFLGDMMDDYYTHLRHGNHYMQRNLQDVHPDGHATDLFTEWAIDYIRQRATSGQPFFLYLAYNAPHTPIQPPPEWVKRVKSRENGVSDRRARLIALVEHLDHGIGRVVDGLAASGVEENTFIIFASDNGGQSNVGADNGPLRGGKQDMYEGGIRVPMCAVWPNRIESGRTAVQRVMSMDIFPTVVEAAEAPAAPDIDGRSFLPLLLGDAPDASPRDLFWTRREGGQKYMGQTIWAIRRGDWKLLQNTPQEPFQLFQLAEDPV
ncbi:MAG: sulfatase-like hydrolase/transferase, partial [Planctomycetota bacterium]